MPDPETIITMVENAMTIVDNEQRVKAQADLTAYENQYSIAAYAGKVIESLLRDELINQPILHLRTCVYLKEYLK